MVLGYPKNSWIQTWIQILLSLFISGLQGLLIRQARKKIPGKVLPEFWTHFLEDRSQLIFS